MKKWEKRNPHLSTITEVIEDKTGFKIDVLKNPKKNPFLMGLSECVQITKECINKDMPITIVGDYDCDGVTSTTVLSLGLKEFTGKEPEVIIPKRFSEGYGLNMSIVDRIEKGLMITVDNGIAAVDQIAKAKEKGLMVIIIDHHIIRDDGLIPEADAILAPSAIDGSEYKEYCGAGLAYRFIMELNPDTKLQKKLVALAGIGTVADVMRLTGDNRRLVLQSLEAVRTGNVTYGLYHLLNAVNVPLIPFASDYGFKVGPCINACGRLKDDGGYRVYSLLKMDCMTGTYTMIEMEDVCKEEALALYHCNEERKKMVYETMQTIYSDLENKEIKAPLVYYKEGLHEGIVGILAGRLAEEYHIPVLVLTNSSKEGIIKGSGRSVPEVHLKSLLNNVSDLFVGWGGHAGAAGMSLEEKNLDELESRLITLLKDTKMAAPDTIFYDLDIEEKDIPDMAERLAEYEPFGEGCPRLRFRLDNFTASPKGNSHYCVMGSMKNHIKIYGNNISLMGFDMYDRYFDMGEPMNIDVIGELSINYSNGKAYYQVEIIDMKKREHKKTDTFKKLSNCFSFI